MLIDCGLVKEIPGMVEAYTIIPEDMKMNPNCPCQTRCCPNHGFCAYCLTHHKELNQEFREMGLDVVDYPACKDPAYLKKQREAKHEKTL